ncbi:type II toxin-antitoxin system PemK/MazF family toxin [Porticoccus sp. W117]|uniref:type II toxin-antitoxin system PemK/MazF family toxin n=1 Tax=Porticoccus sp. W117 TaxID=3054777 RepID=UPI002594FA22|nr:type II toxin-antitoxin system PemK/MazF family toxin [Porticoccus sp. W117]MDM3870038.1 type II toxin-antitoxin system PemK/MazF family toxin [Porticoccus sp. W117]
MYVPEKGDIVTLSFDPSAGNEIMKRRPALVISRQMFNEHTGFAIVAPITSTKRGMALEVELEGTNSQGVVLIHQLRSLDVDSRGVEFVEKAPTALIERATSLAVTIIR